MSAHGITLYGYCARWSSGRTVEPLGTWDSTGQEQLAIESASDEWQGVITATFWSPGAAAGTDMLMTDGACIVPPEALAAPGNGTVTLRCTNAQGRRISVDLAYHSAGHAQVPGSPSEPTPDLWQQYVEQVAADADRAEQASKDAAGSADAAAESAEAAAESAKQAAQATADIGEAKDAALEAIQQAQDTGMKAVQTATTTGVQAIQQAHQAALDDIATDRQQALTDIEAEGEKQTSAITSNGAAALEAIGQVEQTAIRQVQKAGQTQQMAIEQAGQSWQQQIAAAGTAELGRWAPAIWDTTPLATEHDIYAAEGAPLRVTQQGAPEQQTTTGAQLFDADTAAMNTWLADGGVTASAPGFWTTDYIPVQGGQPYSYSSKGSSRGAFYDAQKEYVEAVTDGTTYDGHYTPPQDGYIRLSANGENRTPETFMLNAGSTALPWEPYTGGAPSPSPDYPQAIEGTGFDGKVTFDGTERWKVVSGVYLVLDRAVPADRACVDRLGFCERFPYLYTYANRDLFFAPKNIDGQGTTLYIGQALSAEYGVDVDRWKAALAQWASEGNPLTVYYHAASSTDYTVGISTEDDSGGYHGQALAIGSPLYGDSSVADTVANDVLVDGEHKTVVTRRWRMVELDGTEGAKNYWNDSRDEQLANGRVTFVISGMSALVAGVGSCTHFKLNARVTQGLGKAVGFMTAAGTRLYFCVDLTTIGATAQDTDVQFVQKFDAWLAAQKSAGTPVRVLYQLATHEEYASDPHTLAALGSLPETVKATGQSTVEYSADTKHYIDAKFAALSAAMLGG